MSQLLDRVRECPTCAPPQYPHRGAYVRRVRECVLFSDRKHPSEMGAKEVSAFASHLAAHTLAFSWRAPFDPKSLYRIKGKNVRVSHMTRTTFGDTGGKYTTVFVAAVFLF